VPEVTLRIARNSDPDSMLVYVLPGPLGGTEVPVRSCVRRRVTVDPVLDRSRANERRERDEHRYALD
jgi:hypothetical protein